MLSLRYVKALLITLAVGQLDTGDKADLSESLAIEKLAELLQSAAEEKASEATQQPTTPHSGGQPEGAAFSHDVRKLRDLPTASVFKIYVTSATRSYTLPWQVQTQKHSSGSGFAVGERMIMTNAHVVQNHQFVEVTKQDGAQRFEATVLVIAHDVDLALLTVEDEDFWEGVESVVFEDSLPELYSEVTAVGYPLGGSTVSVTKGVVSRVDAHVYVHAQMSGIMHGSTNSPGPILIVQIDAAINPGNSGGPAFTTAGWVCGVASSGMPDAQNVGYIIPVAIVSNFIGEYLRTRSWGGLSEAGIITRNLENKALRRFLMPSDIAEGSSGVQVQTISPLSPLHDSLAAGDVLLEIDGERISKEGKVRFNLSHRTGVQIPFQALITAKAKSAMTKFKILRRSGSIEEVSVQLRPLPSLAPRFDGIDATPSYLMVGGLVFTTFSTPLLSQATQVSSHMQLLGQGPALSIPKSVFFETMYRWHRGSQDEGGMVVLLRALKHSVNAGYHLDSVRLLRRVNGLNVTGLTSLIAHICALQSRGERFIYFSFQEADMEVPSETAEDPDVVLETEAIAAADREILANNRIPKHFSPDLAQAYSTSCETLHGGGPDASSEL